MLKQPACQRQKPSCTATPDVVILGQEVQRVVRVLYSACQIAERDIIT